MLPSLPRMYGRRKGSADGGAIGNGLKRRPSCLDRARPAIASPGVRNLGDAKRRAQADDELARKGYLSELEHGQTRDRASEMAALPVAVFAAIGNATVAMRTRRFIDWWPSIGTR